ncbi:phospholipase D-like domain-containing protein [Bradyrhizobium barranii]|uniref:phospholipase D-like domain-containing protein n=1 Tax=Bradyrhizobium barranii TaxID=2992140 RepID=UPI0024B0B169|nr:phospholipase D-like domain-containing protein [Bradyrhizobium barranii]WFT97009.1 phospholipase D-like domain-containing protein [Bradyrhizobium barranii]
MTIENSRRVNEVARKIVDASSPDVQADIRKAQQSQRASWMTEATRLLQNRFGAARQGVEEGVSAGIGVDETIVYAVGTPVFLVKNNAIDINSARTEAVAWRKILTASSANLNRHMNAIGRVNVSNFQTDFVGTSFVIDDDLLVTNRHVANLFAETDGAGFKFKLGFDARSPIGATIDFLEEFGNAALDEIPVERVVWIAPDTGPDVAFLKLKSTSSPVSRMKVPLASDTRAKLPVAVIGYPASDPRFSDQDLATKIFGGVYDKKRVAVGNLLGVGDQVVIHSCATLGGNSGSPVLAIESGALVGLHYRGVEFIENDAVSVSALRRCLSRASSVLSAGETIVGSGENSGGGGNGRVTFTVPLKITVELDVAALRSAGLTADPAGSVVMTTGTTDGGGRNPSPTREQVQAAVRSARARLANREDVVAVKPGYRFEQGQITNERAVVISVRRKLDKTTLDSRGVSSLPASIDGVRTDVTVGSTADMYGADLGDEARQKTWHTNYKKRDDLPLDRRKVKTGFVIHSGPDASWPQLSAFLAETKKSLVVAMYDFGAVNVVDGVLDAVKNKTETMSLVLQMGGKVHEGDYTDQESVDKIKAKKKSAFHFAPASVGKDGIFDSAYHIKVAVRDHTSMWLSSGNWQSSNQPDIDPLNEPADAGSALRLYNREWHAILNDAKLSKLYEAHILRDLEEAKEVEEAVPAEEQMVFVPADFQVDALEAAQKPRYFTPLIGNREIDVQPVLTPDNYIDVVVPFIKSARKSVYFQNQSFNTSVIGGDYGKLLDALLDRQKDGLDVRVIFRSFGSDDRDVITAAKDYGFDTDKIRKQRNCHTKGIIVDSESVLIGSHNWTTAGTGYNRDASLVFYDREIARFYEELFLYDWGRIGPAIVDESLPPPILAQPGSVAKPPTGYVGVPLSMLLGR